MSSFTVGPSWLWLWSSAGASVLDAPVQHLRGELDRDFVAQAGLGHVVEVNDLQRAGEGALLVAGRLVAPPARRARREPLIALDNPHLGGFERRGQVGVVGTVVADVPARGGDPAALAGAGVDLA